MELLQGVFVYLVAMVVAVPLAKRFGLGSVLGYLLAGIVIGPALGELHENWRDGGMDTSYVAVARGRAEELERIMRTDRAAERHDSSERGWIPPPKGDARS